MANNSASFMRCDKYSGVLTLRAFDVTSLRFYWLILSKLGGQPVLSCNIIPYLNACAYFLNVAVDKENLLLIFAAVDTRYTILLPNQYLSKSVKWVWDKS